VMAADLLHEELGAAGVHCEVGHTGEEILTADGFIGRRPIAYRAGQTT
jgi:hypothetical protein